MELSTKAKLKMVFSMVREDSLTTMVIFIKEGFKMEKPTVMDALLINMETCTKVNG